MRFRKKQQADPFAAFLQRHGVKTPPKDRPEDAPKDEPDPEPPKPPKHVPTWAHGTLGVHADASQKEISTAYKKLARTHHPDTVATMAPEIREYLEQRMKEINAAYTFLKNR